MIITASQIRAARALLGWTQADLARASRLHTNAIAYWERRAHIPCGGYLSTKKRASRCRQGRYSLARKRACVIQYSGCVFCPEHPQIYHLRAGVPVDDLVQDFPRVISRLRSNKGWLRGRTKIQSPAVKAVTCRAGRLKDPPASFTQAVGRLIR